MEKDLSRSKAAALKAYPVHSVLIHPARGGGFYADNYLREGFAKGYEQAIKEVTREIHKYVAIRFIVNREERILTSYAAGRTEEDKLIMDYIEKLEKAMEEKNNG